MKQTFVPNILASLQSRRSCMLFQKCSLFVDITNTSDFIVLVVYDLVSVRLPRQLEKVCERNMEDVNIL